MDMYLPNGTLLQGGKYKIVRFISSGGFGCTYEAEHVMLEKKVAIKEFFVKDFCNRDETTAHVTVGTTSKKGLVDKLRGKFIDEAKALSRLQHPNIVRVSDVFEENGTAYYVMDYIDGLSLHDMVKQRGALSENVAVKYIRAVADALRCVHDHNRLHLDVKPSNIMIDNHDRAILIDFGASKQYDEENGENTSTLMGKTPGYAPIEQMGNDVVKFMPATDIYALGATLYKLITGVTPLSANFLAGGEELAPLPNGISRNVAEAIYSAMKINKTQRTQDIDTFLNTLNNAGGEVGGDEITIFDPKPPTGSTRSHRTENPEPTPSLIQQTPPHPPSRRGGQQRWRSKIPFKTIGTILCFAIAIALIVWGILSKSQTSKPTTGFINGHECVDLGLSVKWATCNVGASSPSEYGDYYAWGETKTKSSYTAENSETYGIVMTPENRLFRLYNNLINDNYDLPDYDEFKEKIADERLRRNLHKTMGEDGYTMPDFETFSLDLGFGNEAKKENGGIAGSATYDAARANWGATWRLPTASEIDELIDKCKWVWTTRGGHNGYKVTGPNGNSIFLPAAGWRYGSSLYDAGGYGSYWSATPDGDYTSYAYRLFFLSGGFYRDWGHRYNGQSVRPVSE